MSLRLTTKLPLRALYAPGTRTSTHYWGQHLVLPRTTPLRHFWSHPLNSAQQVSQEHLVHVAVNAGQSEGKPAKHISVNIDGEPHTFDTIFLRDSCTCPQCVDPDSKQKSFQTADIPEDIRGSYRTVMDTERGLVVDVVWQNDLPGYGPEHRTRHSIDWLRRAVNTELGLQGHVRSDEKTLWNKDIIIKNNKWVDYNAYMAEDEALFDAISHLNNFGLLFLKNVPESEESVVDIAGRIGNLKDSFYGRTWDVRSKPKADNIAYTQHYLGLHMDLLYTSNPPHLQLLHSIRAQAPGGESFFSDSFHAGNQLHSQSPHHFRTLSWFPVTYEYHHPTQHYHYTRPTIELYPQNPSIEPTDPKIRHVNWSPPFQGPFEARIGGETQSGLRDYASAAHAFDKLLNSEENLFEYRLNEGECVIFDNRRVLHARKAFDATKGVRWLKGAYVDDDVFFSRLRVLEEKFNGSWISNGVVRPAVK